MATPVTSLTRAEKAKLTRAKNKAIKAAAFEYRFNAFESMHTEDQEEMISRLDNIKEEYTTRMGEAEDEILDSLEFEFSEIKDDYGYDAVKSYLEEYNNGMTGFPATFDLNVWADQFADETGFDPDSVSGKVDTLNHMIATGAVEDSAKAEPVLLDTPDACGVCGAPWLDGKCSAGFVNHTQDPRMGDRFPVWL